MTKRRCLKFKAFYILYYYAEKVKQYIICKWQGMRSISTRPCNLPGVLHLRLWRHDDDDKNFVETNSRLEDIRAQRKRHHAFIETKSYQIQPCSKATSHGFAKAMGFISQTFRVAYATTADLSRSKDILRASFADVSRCVPDQTQTWKWKELERYCLSRTRDGIRKFRS